MWQAPVKPLLLFSCACVMFMMQYYGVEQSYGLGQLYGADPTVYSEPNGMSSYHVYYVVEQSYGLG